LWPNGWMDQDGTWHGGRRWSRPHCARWEPSSPPAKGGRAPEFSVHPYCGQTAVCMKMPPGTGVGLSPGDFVLDVDPAPYPKRGGPQFSAHVCCGQTAAWIKMPLGTEVGLSRPTGNVGHFAYKTFRLLDTSPMTWILRLMDISPTG